MIPGVDLKFLHAIVRGMERTALTAYKPAKNRAATSLVLRFAGKDGVKVSKLFSPLDRGASVDTVLSRLEANVDADAPSSLSLFFMLRADVQQDRWSGQVAFPGGKRDTLLDRDDLDTAKREAFEEVGMPLSSPDFVLLGRMPDYRIRSRHWTGEGLILARFVFLHIGELTPSTRLSVHEVAAVQWVPLALLDRKKVRWQRIAHPVVNFIGYSYIETRLTTKDLFPNTLLYFPCIPLGVDGTGDLSKSGRGPSWDLWGITLASVSSLFEMEGRPRIDWPVFRCNNPLIQWLLVNPYHGYVTLADGVRPVLWEHVMSVFLVGLGLACIVELICEFFVAFGTMWANALHFSRDQCALVEREGTGAIRSGIVQYEGRLVPSPEKKLQDDLRVESMLDLDQSQIELPPRAIPDATRSLWTAQDSGTPQSRLASDHQDANALPLGNG